MAMKPPPSTECVPPPWAWAYAGGWPAPTILAPIVVQAGGGESEAVARRVERGAAAENVARPKEREGAGRAAAWTKEDERAKELERAEEGRNAGREKPAEKPREPPEAPRGAPRN